MRYTKAKDDRPLVRRCRACQADIPQTQTAYYVLDRAREPGDEWVVWCEGCVEREPSVSP